MHNKIAIALVTSVWAMSAHAIDSFVVKDIRVEGIQRTEAGTVFSYLPVKVGDTLDADKSAAAIKALYATGFFKDVRLEAQNGVLIVVVEERPAIAKIDIIGSKEFTAEQIKDGLKQSGLAEGRIFDKAMLDRASQEIKRLYFSRGKYAVQIDTTITPLERNRVSITFNVKDGDVAKIRDVNIVGNKAFSEKQLRGLFQLRTPGWFTWYSKNDQYSKQKLSADLETLKSFYLNQGYLEFNIDSTQVSITPDKHDIYLTVNLTEGDKYTVTDVKLAGEMMVPAAELQKLITLKAGDTFSREKITESAKKIGDRLGNDGYAFANVNAVPEIDKDKHTVAFTFFVDAGRRVYVNRININGNTRTRDEVVRREFRQMEGGWYAADKIQRSRERVERLGYFSDINVETPPVTGTTDQVDVNLSVTEKATGNIMVGAGFSSSEGLILSGSISQNNLFGSGNALTARINSGGVNKIYSISYTNPYFTPDGLSLGYDVYRRDTDTSRLTALSTYKNSTVGAGVRLGIPLNEKDAISLGLAYERFTLTTYPTSPVQYVNFVNQYGSTNDTVRADLGWSRDSRDSLTYPTKGMLQRVYGEIGVPPGSLKYYKLNYQHQWFQPLSKNFTLMLNGEVGYGDGYGGQGMPFFKNFYAGGVSSVRGYDTATIGPKYQDPTTGAIVSAGGTQRVVANAELLFPMPGMENDKSVRLSAFFDAGEVAGPGDYLGRYSSFSFQDLRYSTGLALNWVSPVGPLKFSLAQPLNPQSDDKKQVFQFTLGQVF
ncbi:outer membrane protein assembly factor BamA [Sulfuriferula thiophila]|uniref:outer membrane protein assembly factor BamA n=1 Tax=Sulfuriferula thiophila TaxID=1781211 RepID=UPI000F610D8C